jgi:endonuclease-3
MRTNHSGTEETIIRPLTPSTSRLPRDRLQRSEGFDYDSCGPITNESPRRPMESAMRKVRTPHSKQEAAPATSAKEPFNFAVAFRRLRKAVRPFPKAAMFELAAQGHTTVFELLIACILSIRTRDETSLPASLRLFARARTPLEISRLSVEQIDALIADCTFHDSKSFQIREIANRAATDFGGVLPCDPDVLQTFSGVGPKCANLVAGITGERSLISVDIHVHRVTNRWGIVHAATPEKTMRALEAVLPRRLWVEINALLVPFGKHICTGARPICSTCPLLAMCRQIGVTTSR